MGVRNVSGMCLCQECVRNCAISTADVPMTVDSSFALETTGDISSVRLCNPCFQIGVQTRILAAQHRLMTKTITTLESTLDDGQLPADGSKLLAFMQGAYNADDAES